MHPVNSLSAAKGASASPASGGSSPIEKLEQRVEEAAAASLREAGAAAAAAATATAPAAAAEKPEEDMIQELWSSAFCSTENYILTPEQLEENAPLFFFCFARYAKNILETDHTIFRRLQSLEKKKNSDPDTSSANKIAQWMTSENVFLYLERVFFSHYIATAEKNPSLQNAKLASDGVICWVQWLKTAGTKEKKNLNAKEKQKLLQGLIAQSKLNDSLKFMATKLTQEIPLFAQEMRDRMLVFEERMKKSEEEQKAPNPDDLFYARYLGDIAECRGELDKNNQAAPLSDSEKQKWQRCALNALLYHFNTATLVPSSDEILSLLPDCCTYDEIHLKLRLKPGTSPIAIQCLQWLTERTGFSSHEALMFRIVRFPRRQVEIEAALCDHIRRFRIDKEKEAEKNRNELLELLEADESPVKKSQKKPSRQLPSPPPPLAQLAAAAASAGPRRAVPVTPPPHLAQIATTAASARPRRPVVVTSPSPLAQLAAAVAAAGSSDKEEEAGAWSPPVRGKKAPATRPKPLYSPWDPKQPHLPPAKRYQRWLDWAGDCDRVRNFVDDVAGKQVQKYASFSDLEICEQHRRHSFPPAISIASATHGYTTSTSWSSAFPATLVLPEGRNEHSFLVMSFNGREIHHSFFHPAQERDQVLATIPKEESPTAEPSAELIASIREDLPPQGGIFLRRVQGKTDPALIFYVGDAVGIIWPKK